MKKQYITYIDETAEMFDKIAVSAGLRGQQILIEPNDLIDYINARKADVTD